MPWGVLPRTLSMFSKSTSSNPDFTLNLTNLDVVPQVLHRVRARELTDSFQYPQTFYFWNPFEIILVPYWKFVQISQNASFSAILRHSRHRYLGAKTRAQAPFFMRGVWGPVVVSEKDSGPFHPPISLYSSWKIDFFE